MTQSKNQRKSKDPNKIDLAELRRVVKLMESSELHELEIELEGKRVRIVRGAPGHVVATAPVAAAAPAPSAPEAAPEEEPKRGDEILSPMVGTFYRAPSPDASPFVEVGDRVGRESVVCIVEAMKVMNEIKAEVEGEVLEILVQNGEPVEYGQPLFLVRASGGAA